jgi:16S rRNA (uracil1498-N3)-methyltransferase
VNLLLLEPDELAPGGVARLIGRRADHLRRVLAVAPGRILKAGVVDGPRGQATVREVTAAHVEVEFVQGPSAAAPTVEVAAEVALWLAVPRPKVLSRLLQVVAMLGVERVELTNAWRVDKSYLGSPRLAAAAIREDLLLGAEQGGTTRLPRVTVVPRLMALIDRAAAEPGRRLLAHPHAGAPLEHVVPPGAVGAVTVAIGPEGGWIERELATLEGVGFQPVSLGAAILRTEAAVVAVVAQLRLLARLGAPGAGG